MNVYHHNIPDYIPDHFPAIGAEFEDTPDHAYTTRELERTIVSDKMDLILTNTILAPCRILVLCSLRLLRWLEAAGKLRSFLLDLPDLQLQRPLPQLHLAYVQLHLAVSLMAAASQWTKASLALFSVD